MDNIKRDITTVWYYIAMKDLGYECDYTDPRRSVISQLYSLTDTTVCGLYRRGEELLHLSPSVCLTSQYTIASYKFRASPKLDSILYTKPLLNLVRLLEVTLLLNG